MIRSRKWMAILLFPGFAGFALFFVYPVISGIYFSMVNYFDNKRFVFIEHYLNLLKTSIFRKALLNTVCITSAGVLILVTCSFIMAYYIWKIDLLKKLLKIVALPFAIAAVTVSFVWESLFNVNGNINNFLSAIGLQPVNWQSGIFMYFPLLLLFVWRYIGICIIVFVSALSTVPAEVSEAFFLDSRSDMKRMYHIMIPGIISQTIFVIFISLMYCLFLSQDIFTIWKDYPPEPLYMLQHFITNSFRKLNYENAASASTILLVITGFGLAMLRRLERRNEGQ